ncbi:MAG TPA: aminotransferase class III-fold pyridoxal phosphate-dependent enzyme [Candidatus Brocadiia bacterium]|nr:aminotransferase class III-fold pyridoxal phosphate-dependent enzyme [Candidatus Brocadiia bacterium]
MDHVQPQPAQRSLAHFAKASRLIPWANQTGAKKPSILTDRYGASAPLYVARARGAHFWDLDGNRFIDCRAALGPIILGHCDPVVDAAVKEQIDRGVIYSMPSERELELAELVVQAVPSAEMVRFFKTGGAACNAAVRIARARTGREIVLSQGYHGWHDLFAAAEPASRRGVPAALQSLIHTFPYGGLDAAEHLMRQHGERVACIIVNAFAGGEPPPPGYLQGLRRLAHEQGALLIFDEVKTGFRLALGGAQERFGVLPDLTVLAKSMANGYPMAAVAGRRDIMAVLDEAASPGVMISNTLAGDLIGIAAAIATIRALKDTDAYARLHRSGETLMRGLQSILDRTGVEGAVLGEPAFFSMRIQGAHPRTGERLLMAVCREMLRAGVFCLGDFLITVAHDEAVVAEILERAEKAFLRALA